MIILQFSMWPNKLQRPTGDDEEPPWTHISHFLPRSKSKPPFSDYWEAECEFVKVAVRALEWIDTDAISIWRQGDLPGMIPVTPNESILEKVPIQHLDPVIRSNLRDYTWTRLFFEDKLYITFGYDMNMYIGFSHSAPDDNSDALRKIHWRDVSDRSVDTDFHFFGAARPE